MIKPVHHFFPKTDDMVSVEEAERIVRSQIKDFGVEPVTLEAAAGRVLAENIQADRDLPPFNRTTMDGIAISYQAYESGIRTFRIHAIQAAGDHPVEINGVGDCVEIMTGSALPESTDTIVPYEDIQVENKEATIFATVQKGQNIHRKGKDKKQHDILVHANRLVTPPVMAVAASAGKAMIAVKKLPHTVIISTGNELVDVSEHPSPYQIRRSNNYMIRGVLQQYNLQADMLHMPDDPEIIKEQLKNCLNRYEAMIFSGGVSMGKFDYLPQVFKALQVRELFYKVQQRPGKPFWFGTHLSGARIFALPGNPVSTFLCLHRFFLPWLTASLELPPLVPVYAALDADIQFMPAVTYFVQVKLHADEQGHLFATPEEGNGSGDFSNLLDTNAFMELPAQQSYFAKGETFRVWPFKPLFLSLS